MATTTEHGWHIHDEDAAVLSCTYTFAPNATANAFAARMKDGKMLIISPPTNRVAGLLDDIEAYGEVGAIVAPNGFHHLGLSDWKERFPGAVFCAAPDAIKRIKKKNRDAPELTTIESIQPSLGDNITITESSNMKLGDTWAHANTANGNVWYACDMLSNMDAYPPNFFLRSFFKWTGTKLGLGVFHTAMKFTARDKKKALAELKAEMAEKAPSTIVPGHGAFVSEAGLAERAQGILAEAL